MALRERLPGLGRVAVSFTAAPGLVARATGVGAGTELPGFVRVTACDMATSG